MVFSVVSSDRKKAALVVSSLATTLLWVCVVIRDESVSQRNSREERSTWNWADQKVQGVDDVDEESADNRHRSPLSDGSISYSRWCRSAKNLTQREDIPCWRWWSLDVFHRCDCEKPTSVPGLHYGWLKSSAVKVHYWRSSWPTEECFPPLCRRQISRRERSSFLPRMIVYRVRPNVRE